MKTSLADGGCRLLAAKLEIHHDMFGKNQEINLV
jgi:hypothetical protein